MSAEYTHSSEYSHNVYVPGCIENKNVLVTGATTGIGRAIALYLKEQGAHVFIVGLTPEHLEDALQSIGHAGMGGSIDGMIADLSTGEGIKSVFEELDKRFETLDILVNNVGNPFQSVKEGTYEDWEYVVNTNVTSYLACARYALDRMLPRKAGHIVNIGSMSADSRGPDSSVYVATKSANQAFSESLRKEVNESGIKVTLIEPGKVGTDFHGMTVQEQEEKQENLEMLKAEDIAAAVVYALSQPARCDVIEIKIRPHLEIK